MIRLFKLVLFVIPGLILGAAVGIKWAWTASGKSFEEEV